MIMAVSVAPVSLNAFSKDFRDFFIRKSKHIEKNQGHPVSVRQAQKRASDLIAYEIMKQIFLVEFYFVKMVVLDRAGKLGKLDVIFVEESYFLLAIVHVDIGIDHDFLKPGSASRIALEFAESLESPKIRLLEQILGAVVFSRESFCQSHQITAMHKSLIGESIIGFSRRQDRSI